MSKKRTSRKTRTNRTQRIPKSGMEDLMTLSMDTIKVGIVTRVGGGLISAL